MSVPGDLFEVLLHGGERRQEVLGLGHVVEADHAHVARHVPTGLVQGPHDAEHQVVVAGETAVSSGRGGQVPADAVARRGGPGSAPVPGARRRGNGIDVPLFTSDQPADLAGGSLPGVMKTVNFGGRPEAKLAVLREHQPDGPLMCAEFWFGWFDQWGRPDVVRDAADAARDLDALLAAGPSVDFYMFRGGTNFGFTNGANSSSRGVRDRAQLFLGRCWSRGPQRALYVPGPVLRRGDNEIVVLELHAAPCPRTVDLRDRSRSRPDRGVTASAIPDGSQSVGV